MAELSYIAQFILDNFLRIWPYLLLTIPLAVVVNLSGASKYIRRAFDAGPIMAILLATAVGAFSPFCSCTVIPIVASLLISGVPLAPVMAFWIASPAMDPEIFLLSVGMLGWELAVWRLTGTLAISLGAGLLTHFIMLRGWLGDDILRRQGFGSVRGGRELLIDGWRLLRRVVERRDKETAVAATIPLGPAMTVAHTIPVADSSDTACCGTDADRSVIPLGSLMVAAPPVVAVPDSTAAACCGPDFGGGSIPLDALTITATTPPLDAAACCSTEVVEADAACCGDTGVSSAAAQTPFRTRLLRETWAATKMVVQFMLLAFLLEALILLFVPEQWIVDLLGAGNRWAVPLAALLGVPVYTSNLTALPLIGGLLEQGMHPGAALAFLISGPTTTLPAMAAVYGLVQRRVFALYVSIALVGAMLLGLVLLLVNG